MAGCLLKCADEQNVNIGTDANANWLVRIPYSPTYYSYYWSSHWTCKPNARRHCSLKLFSTMTNLDAYSQIYERTIVARIRFGFNCWDPNYVQLMIRLDIYARSLRDEIVVYTWLSVMQGPCDTQSLFAWQVLALVALCSHLVCLIVEPLHTHIYECVAYRLMHRMSQNFCHFP